MKTISHRGIGWGINSKINENHPTEGLDGGENSRINENYSTEGLDGEKTQE